MMVFRTRRNEIDKRRTVRLLIISAVLFLLSQTAKRIGLRHPGLIEKYYSGGIYPVTSKVQTSIANLFPFSLYELVAAALVLYGIYRIIRLIRSIPGKKFAEEMVSFLTVVIFLISAGIFLFQLLWSLNNYRIPLKDQLGLDVKETSVDDLAGTYKALILKANDLRSVFADVQDTDSDREKIRKVLETAWEGYPPLTEEYPLFHSYRVRVKGLLFSRVQTISGYSGKYSFITGEPNINTEPPLVTLPHTACHEIAHQMGINREDEANYAGFLACKSHPDMLFRYSGYLSALTYAGNALYRQSPELYWEISSLLSDDLKKDMKENRDFWNRYQNDTITRIADNVNEIYLKSNNQPKGIQSYGGFVDLLIADYLKDNDI